MMYLKMNQIEDDKLRELLEIYEEVEKEYGPENCFLYGSMAIYFMCKMLNIDVGGFKPNDVDIMIQGKREWRLKDTNTWERSITINNGTYEYDLLAHPKTVKRYHYIDFIKPNNESQRIQIFPVTIILHEYQEQLDEGKPNAQQKVDLLNQIIQADNANKENNSFILKTVKIESQRRNIGKVRGLIF